MDNGTAVNSLLGFPPEARLLIINVDDLGMCHSMNMAAMEALQSGVATSTTLMAPCPWAVHAARLLEDRPDLHCGVHLTAVSEQPLYRWGPCAPRETVRTLMDESGYFYNEERIPELLSRLSLRELEREFRAQIEAVLRGGLHPTHVDSHCDIHVRRDDVFDMVKGLAREYRMALRVSKPRFIQALQREGLAANSRDDLDSMRVPAAEKAATYTRLLRELPPGLSEWAVHPGIPTEELRAVTPSWEQRAEDLRFLTSEEARAILREEGIVLLSYAPLREQWLSRLGG